MTRVSSLLATVTICIVLAPGALCAQTPLYSLEDLYRLALKQSERIKIAQEEVIYAEKEKDKALSLLIPRLTTIGDTRRYSHSDVGTTGSLAQPEKSNIFTLRADQQFSLGLRELTALRITKTGIQRSKQDLQSVQEDYLQRVALAYYAVFRAKRAIEIQQTNVARLTRYRDAAQTRLKVGEVTKTTVLRAQAELSGASSDLVKARNLYDLTVATLARVVGLTGDFTLREEPGLLRLDSPEGGSARTISIDGCFALDFECLRQKALTERPDVRSFEYQVKIAEDQVKFVKGSYWPTLSVEGNYIRRDETPATSGLVKESTFGNLRLTFPLFEGGLRKAEVAQAEVRDRQTKLGLADLKESVGIEVESAYLDLRTQVGILKSLEDQLAFSRDNFNAVSKQFEFGLASALDVLDANTQLVTAERQLADAEFDYQFSLVRLRRSTGTLLKTVMNAG